VNDLLTGILTALLSTNSPATISNLINSRAPLVKAALQAVESDPVEAEFKRLMEQDDEARERIDSVIQQNAQDDSAKPALKRLGQAEQLEGLAAPVRKAYEAFIAKHPRHARARIAYGSFLNEIAEEGAGLEQWLKAKEIDPKDPAAWNNLANHYGHNGPLTNALTHYAKAIELNPHESVYYQNLAATLYLFRVQSADFLGKSVQEVMNASMQMYHKAMELDPSNFRLATDVAQSYYGLPGFKGAKTEPEMIKQRGISENALNAWTNAFRLAGDDIERQGVLIHMARLSLHLGRKSEAQAALNSVTNAMFTSTRTALLRKLQQEGRPAAEEKTPAKASAEEPKR